MKTFFLALFVGMLYMLGVTFFIILSAQLYYLEHYDIHVYYNPLYVDSINLYFYILSSIVIGFVIILANKLFIHLVVASIFFSIAILSFYPPFGYSVGDILYKKRSVTLQSARHTYDGDILYSGRGYYEFFDYELNRKIMIQKKDLLR